MFNLKKNIRIRVSGVVRDSDGKILMIQHKKGRNKYWLLPGGGVEFGETLPEALAREILEELNIRVKVNDILFVSDSIEPHGKLQILNISFLCDYVDGEVKLAREKRLHDYGYFTIDELNDLLIIPPIKDKMIEILKRKIAGGDETYLGAKWVEL